MYTILCSVIAKFMELKLKVEIPLTHYTIAQPKCYKICTMNPEKLASILFGVFITGSILVSNKFSILRKSAQDNTHVQSTPYIMCKPMKICVCKRSIFTHNHYDQLVSTLGEWVQYLNLCKLTFSMCHCLQKYKRQKFVSCTYAVRKHSA